MASKPVAVLISDIHYNINTLPLADAALRQAVNKANELRIPLIIAGDLHDTKANLRGECVTAMIATLDGVKHDCYILVGNHDRINEKSVYHSLTFLDRPKLNVITEIFVAPIAVSDSFIYLIPYHHDPDDLRGNLSRIPKGSTLIMHQGLEGSNMGDYIQDKSAINHEDVENFRVISGHYHARQDIKTGPNGLWSYIGNPYTLGWGEANDPPKGFQILMDDGSLQFVPTNLRKHIVYEQTVEQLYDAFNVPPKVNKGDLLWIKVTGTKEDIQKLTKWDIGETLGYSESDFRLDLIPLDTITKTAASSIEKTQPELLDSFIDSISNTSDDRKVRLKALWRKHV